MKKDSGCRKGRWPIRDAGPDLWWRNRGGVMQISRRHGWEWGEMVKMMKMVMRMKMKMIMKTKNRRWR